MKVLIVEDDKDLSRVIEQTLHAYEESCEISTAYDGDEGYAKAMNYDFDVIILDLMLPGMSGQTILHGLRKSKATPVIILTAIDEGAEKVKLLNDGADDYLTKPFSREELIARVNAVLRRYNKSFTTWGYKLGGLEVDYTNKSVTFNGELLPIAGKKYEIFEMLVRNEGSIVTKTQIFNRVWGFYSDTILSVIEVHISYLRRELRKIGMDGHLSTITNAGYIWRGGSSD